MHGKDAATTFERRLDGRLVASMAAAGSLSFSAVTFETALNVALPTLMEEFGVGTSTIQWITSGYLLMLSMVIPAFPWLKSRFPLRRLFLVAVALFIAGTLACGLAPAFGVLLAGRLVQGAGTGIAIPLMFSIVVDQVPHDRMGLMMGVASLITALAPAIGPTYGGVVMGLASWRWVFLALVPLVAAALFVGAATVRQATGLSRSRFDVMGFAMVAVAFFGLVYGTNLASEHGWASVPVLGCYGAAAVLLTAFGRHALILGREARAERRPLIDVTVFTCGAFTVEVLSVALQAAMVLAFAYLVPNYAQLALGADALTAGTMLLPGCLATVVCGPIGGRLLDRMGAKLPVLAGTCLVLAACALFLGFSAALTPMLMLAFYGVFGLGQGLGFSTTMTNGLDALPQAKRTDGNSVFNTLQQLGGSIGVSVVTAIIGAAQAGAPAAQMASATATGGATAFAVLAAMATTVVLLSLAAFALRRREERGGRR